MSTARRPSTSVAVWVLLGLVLLATLAFSVGRGDGRPTNSQRADQIDSGLKCPSCESISVLDSSAATAAAVRQVVLSRVEAGESDAQIDNYLVSRYGPSILLRPPTTGLTAVVWVLPLVAAGAGAGGLALFFWRRRRPAVVAVSSQDRALVDRALAEHGRHGTTGPPSTGP